MAFIVNTYTEDGNEVIIGGRADGDEQETLSLAQSLGATSVSGSISALYDWAERAGALGGTSGCLGCITGSKDIHQHASDCAFTIQMTTPPEAIVPGVF